jgi:UPF0755 protein
MRRGSGRDGVRGTATRLLLVCAVAALVTASVWAVAVPAGSGDAQLVMVSPGESVSDVARMLTDAGIVRNQVGLVAAAYVTGKWRRIQAGRHELAPDMTALEILDALCRGSRKAWRWLTIPEGYTVRQIAERVEEGKLGSASRLLSEAERPEQFSVGFPLPGGSLEGYLFPDTYRVDASEDERAIVGQMVRRFEQVVWEGLFEKRPLHGGRSVHDIIILASLVEAEAKRDDERPIIAGVLWNRLRQGRALECDATVQYALGENRKHRLNHDDLKIESEYNTYLREGLPPGPICNPGEASIRAGMNPARVRYMYYVARPDGSHVFSETFAQHQAAIARVRSGG